MTSAFSPANFDRPVPKTFLDLMAGPRLPEFVKKLFSHVGRLHQRSMEDTVISCSPSKLRFPIRGTRVP